VPPAPPCRLFQQLGGADELQVDRLHSEDIGKLLKEHATQLRDIASITSLPSISEQPQAPGQGQGQGRLEAAISEEEAYQEAQRQVGRPAPATGPFSLISSLKRRILDLGRASGGGSRSRGWGGAPDLAAAGTEQLQQPDQQRGAGPAPRQSVPTALFAKAKAAAKALASGRSGDYAARQQPEPAAPLLPGGGPSAAAAALHLPQQQQQLDGQAASAEAAAALEAVFNDFAADPAFDPNDLRMTSFGSDLSLDDLDLRELSDMLVDGSAMSLMSNSSWHRLCREIQQNMGGGGEGQQGAAPPPGQ
jgi:hypothetical protein